MRDLNIYSTKPQDLARPSRIVGQGHSQAGIFWCAIYSVINRESVVQSLANNRSKYTKEKSFIREGILRKMCCSFGFCPNEGGVGSCPIFWHLSRMFPKNMDMISSLQQILWRPWGNYNMDVFYSAISRGQLVESRGTDF